MTSEIERKLAIILSADVYGFSRLMSRDEAGTLATLSAYRATVTGLIERHQGRLVNSAGDSLLAEFASPVMAMQCAVAIQREIGERNGKLPPDQQMWFRIGINLGDVMVERDDIFGDDVNIAARLQGMAEPGGIMISGTVFDQVKHKVTLGFDFLGPQHLKNIAAEVPVYRAVLKPDVTPPPPAGEPAPGSAPPSPEEKRRRLMMSGVRAGALILFLLLINLFSWDGGLWFQWPALAIVLIFVLHATGVSGPHRGRHSKRNG